MSASRRPWMKWNPSDWRADQAVQSCSLAARGLWLEMLGLMHEAEPYGYLMLNGNPISTEQLSRLVRADVAEVESLIEELESVGVFSRDRKRQIYSRRMIRDEKKAKIGKKYAKQRWEQDTETIDEKPVPNGSGHGGPTEPPMLRTKKEELREKKEPPKPPMRAMLEIWNETCHRAGLPEAQKLPPARAKSLALRLKADFGNDLEQWRAYCRRIAASEFLTGRAAPGPGRDRPFKADINWVLNPTNLAKIVEGNYGDGPGANGHDEGPYLGEHNDDLRTDWRRLMRWQANGEWMFDWGPKPGEAGCKIAAEVMEKYGPNGEAATP